jgi:hypothetical protein
LRGNQRDVEELGGDAGSVDEVVGSREQRLRPAVPHDRNDEQDEVLGFRW